MHSPDEVVKATVGKCEEQETNVANLHTAQVNEVNEPFKLKALPRLFPGLCPCSFFLEPPRTSRQLCSHIFLLVVCFLPSKISREKAQGNLLRSWIAPFHHSMDIPINLALLSTLKLRPTLLMRLRLN
jgi:hypothetical protein